MAYSRINRGTGWLEAALDRAARVPLWALSALTLVLLAVADISFLTDAWLATLTLVTGLAMAAHSLTRCLRHQRLFLAAFWIAVALVLSGLPPGPVNAHLQAYRAVRPGMTVGDVYAHTPDRSLAELPDDFTGIVSLFGADGYGRFLLVFEDGRVLTRRYGRAEDLLYRYRAIAPGMTQDEVHLLMTGNAAEMADPTYQQETLYLPPSANSTRPGWQSYRLDAGGVDGVRVQFDDGGARYKEITRDRD